MNDAAIPGESEGRAVGVQYLADQGGACFATSNGNLTLWTLDINQVRNQGMMAFDLLWERAAFTYLHTDIRIYALDVFLI